MSRRFLTPPQLPSGASLPSSGAAGDLFFKSDEAKIYVHDGTNWVIAQGSGGSGSGVVVSATAPVDPTEGTYWFDSTTTKSYIYYDSFWVEVGYSGGGYIISETAPSNPTAGDVWFSTSEGVIYVFYDNFWVDPSTGGAAGVPSGGLEGQVLVKTTDADYDTMWMDHYVGELRITVKNDSGATISKGKAVMSVGAVGDRIQVALANADGSVSSRFILGLASENIADGEEGYVNLLGDVTNLDTSAYNVGTVLYIDPTTPGNLTSTEPTSPALDLAVAIVTRSHASTGRLFVRMWNQGMDLAEINDVAISNLANGETLVYNSSTGLWENGATASDVSSLTDTTFTNLSDGEILQYDSANSVWVNGPRPITSIIDGGDPTSSYAGDAIDGGSVSSF